MNSKLPVAVEECTVHTSNTNIHHQLVTSLAGLPEHFSVWKAHKPHQLLVHCLLEMLQASEIVPVVFDLHGATIDRSTLKSELSTLQSYSVLVLEKFVNRNVKV